MITDKGPQQQWLWEIGKSEKPCCVCDGWTAQNAAHLMGCPWVGDGRGRKSEMIWEDVGRVQRELALPPGWEAVCGVTRTLKRGEKYHLVYV